MLSNSCWRRKKITEEERVAIATSHYHYYYPSYDTIIVASAIAMMSLFTNYYPIVNYYYAARIAGVADEKNNSYHRLYLDGAKRPCVSGVSMRFKHHLEQRLADVEAVSC